MKKVIFSGKIKVMKFRHFFLAVFSLLLVFGFIYWINSYNPLPEVKTPIGNTSVVNNIQESSSVRKSAVAGSFYPASPNELISKLDNFLSNAKKVESKGLLQLLIVPHAAIEYSGQTAAYGYKQIEGKNYNRIILIGASHNYLFGNIAVYGEGAWETPLGKVDVDENFAKLLIDNNITEDAGKFDKEHSLEVELIFLQRVLKNFKIVPILIGDSSEGLLTALADKISDNLDASTLVAISTDLSHYPDYEAANKVDKKTMDAILTGNEKAFVNYIANIKYQKYANLETAACGYKVVQIGLKIAQNLGFEKFQQIYYQNSGDVTTAKDRVVGYGAIGIWDEDFDQSLNYQLDEQAQKEALKLARSTLTNFLNNNYSLSSTITKSDILRVPLGAFVTLRNSEKQLRGCIGEFEPKEKLSKVIENMTIAAASKDMRFQPVAKSELNDINIEISVMSPRRKISNWQEFELGKQGVVVESGQNAGTFLPQVATENNWTKEQFLSELCIQKAHLSSDCYKDSKTTLYVFDAQVFAEKD
jgi:MEMO1 family protein